MGLFHCPPPSYSRKYNQIKDDFPPYTTFWLFKIRWLVLNNSDTSDRLKLKKRTTWNLSSWFVLYYEQNFYVFGFWHISIHTMRFENDTEVKKVSMWSSTHCPTVNQWLDEKIFNMVEQPTKISIKKTQKNPTKWQPVKYSTHIVNNS